MRTVDQILDDAANDRTSSDQIEVEVPRYPRTRNVQKVRELSQVNGFRSTCSLAFQWTIIILATAAAGYSGNIWVYIVAALVITTRVQALTILVHDGAHYLLYKNRTTNDVVCDLFAAFPLGISTTLFRKTHFRHHRFLNSEEDQDLAAHQQDEEWYEWPKSRGGMIWTLVRSVLGINAYRGWVIFKHWVPWNNFTSPDFPRRARVLYVLSMAAFYTLIAFGLKMNPRMTLSLIAMHMISGMTLLNIIGRVRATAEHFGTKCTHELNSSRTIVPTLLERMVLAPYGVSYHLEHHLFPSVPGCNLNQLHKELMQDEEFREHAHITHGYVGLFSELMSPSNWKTSDSDAPEGQVASE